jgi:hypothetical protein
VIMMICNADNFRFRRGLIEDHFLGSRVYWTVEDFDKVYEESGWKEENERLGHPAI